MIKSRRITELEHEVVTTKEYFQATTEELETTNEELKSTNEEMQSSNEEMQSTNEELETSREELQSVNEELVTVNTELQKKIEELDQVNNDMNNLLAGTGIGTIFVDHKLIIQRFTPAAAKVINLIPTDVGRPVGHIVPRLTTYDSLDQDIKTVLDTSGSPGRGSQDQGRTVVPDAHSALSHCRKRYRGRGPDLCRYY